MITTTMICRPIPEARRAAYAHKVFGSAFSFVVEPAIFDFAALLSPDYKGGMWLFIGLCPSGFYMYPDSDAEFRVVSPNGYEGTMSAEAMGIAACLFAYSHLSFRGDTLAEVCAEQYHRLREYALDHPECGAILAAID
jgi:Antirestriction protein